MATLNPFDLLDDDAEDPSLVIAAEQQKQVPPPASVPKKGPAQQSKPAAKPLPPSEAGNFNFLLIICAYPCLIVWDI